MTEILSIKDITFGNSSSTLSSIKILDLGYSPRSDGKIPNTNKISLKEKSNILSKEHQAQTRPQTNNRNTKYERNYS